MLLRSQKHQIYSISQTKIDLASYIWFPMVSTASRGCSNVIHDIHPAKYETIWLSSSSTLVMIIRLLTSVANARFSFGMLTWIWLITNQSSAVFPCNRLLCLYLIRWLEILGVIGSVVICSFIPNSPRTMMKHELALVLIYYSLNQKDHHLQVASYHLYPFIR